MNLMFPCRAILQKDEAFFMISHYNNNTTSNNNNKTIVLITIVKITIITAIIFFSLSHALSVINNNIKMGFLKYLFLSLCIRIRNPSPPEADVIEGVIDTWQC